MQPVSEKIGRNTFKKATSEYITNFLTFKILNKKKKFEAFPISYYSIDGEKTAKGVGPSSRSCSHFLGGARVLVKAAVCCLAPGLWNEMRRTPEAFQCDWRRSTQWWVFGEVFFFPFGPSKTRKVGNKVGGVFFFFLGKRGGGKKVEQAEKVKKKVENLEMLPALMVSNKHSTNRYENS